MSNIITPNLRKIADNLDVLADHEKRHGHDRYVAPIRNNAAYLRRAATTIFNTEIAMGRVANDLAAAETARDAEKARADRLQAQLDAQTPNVLDAADIAALDKFEADQATAATAAASNATTATTPPPANPAAPDAGTAAPTPAATPTP